MTGLQIGKCIKTILSGLDKVFPMIADKDTEYPFIVYRRYSLTPSSSKDRYCYRELATVEIIVAATTYAESISLAEQVKQKMCSASGEYNGIVIGGIVMTDALEQYLEDAFIQKMTFQIEVNY